MDGQWYADRIRAPTCAVLRPRRSRCVVHTFTLTYDFEFQSHAICVHDLCHTHADNEG